MPKSSARLEQGSVLVSRERQVARVLQPFRWAAAGGAEDRRRESGKDVALASLAHNGLKSLTGKNIPADPEKWNGVIHTGFEIVPEPSMIQRAVATVVD